MAYAERQRECAGCGIVLTGKLPPVKPVRCFECGIARAMRAANQMAAKDGEHYTRWLESRGPQGRPRKPI